MQPQPEKGESCFVFGGRRYAFIVDEELREIARTLVWWKPPEQVDFHYLVRRVMEMGTPEMVHYARANLGDETMRTALSTAEAGNFSAPSWNYWHVVFGLRPTPPLPQRAVPDSPHVSAEIRRAAWLRMPEPRLLQRKENTLTVDVDGPKGPVKLSFFGTIDFGQIRPPDVCADNGLKVASAEDLLALKLATIQQRIEAKDYLDISALLRAGLDLEKALGHLEALHPLATNAMITLKTLVYFEGGDLGTLPADVKLFLEENVRQVREAVAYRGGKVPIGTV
jgi:hypothetical protein